MHLLSAQWDARIEDGGHDALLSREDWANSHGAPVLSDLALGVIANLADSGEGVGRHGTPQCPPSLPPAFPRHADADRLRGAPGAWQRAWSRCAPSCATDC